MFPAALAWPMPAGHFRQAKHFALVRLLQLLMVVRLPLWVVVELQVVAEARLVLLLWIVLPVKRVLVLVPRPLCLGMLFLGLPATLFISMIILQAALGLIIRQPLIVKLFLL